MREYSPLERLARGGPLYEPEPDWPGTLYWLWLAGVLGPAFAHSQAVVREYGDARQVWLDRRDLDRFAAVAGAAAARRLEESDKTPADHRRMVRTCEAGGIRILTYTDADYPAALHGLEDAPLVLYCTGDTRWLNAGRTVGIVGSRSPSDYGVEAAARLGGVLAQNGAVIVSGLADGLDSEGHRAAVDNDAPTIAVLGVAIHKTYPSGNLELRRRIERNGVVVSEYPPTSDRTYSTAFLHRNRIIAGLSSALLVVEARQKSGTMSTVSHAVRYGRPVFAVPGSIFSSLSQGTNELLESGRARPATTGWEILSAIGVQPPRQSGKAPAAKKPAARKPAAEKPVAEKPAAEKPAAKKPAARKPAAEKPVAEKPAAKKPAARKPAAEKPVAEKPAAKKPAAQKQAAPKPGTGRPAALSFSPEELAVLDNLGYEAKGLSLLLDRTGLGMGTLLSVLSKLEIEGLILQLPGRQYRLK